jgi:hypothetical protein
MPTVKRKKDGKKGRGSNPPALPKSLKSVRDRNAEIVRLHAEDGLSYSVIARQFGLTPEAVRQRINRSRFLDPTAPPKVRRLSQEEKHFIRTHLDQGYSVFAIGNALKRNEAVIRNFIKREGIEYTSQSDPSHSGMPTTRIVIGNDRKGNDSDELVSRIVSAGRRSTTLAAVAREANVSESIAERILKTYAPLVWRYQIKGNKLPHGSAISNTAGDLTFRAEMLADNGLVNAEDYDNLVTDYGSEEVGLWLDKLEEDRRAINSLILKLRRALERKDME